MKLILGFLHILIAALLSVDLVAGIYLKKAASLAFITTSCLPSQSDAFINRIPSRFGPRQNPKAAVQTIPRFSDLESSMPTYFDVESAGALGVPRESAIVGRRKRVSTNKRSVDAFKKSIDALSLVLPQTVIDFDFDPYFHAIWLSNEMVNDNFWSKKKLKEFQKLFDGSEGEYRIYDTVSDPDTDIQLVIIRNERTGEVGISVPGTKSIKNVQLDMKLAKTNLMLPINDVCQNVRSSVFQVPEGFSIAYNSVLPKVTVVIKRLLKEHPFTPSISLVGYSLGGAIASYLAANIRSELIQADRNEIGLKLFTFGCPPVAVESIPLLSVASDVVHFHFPDDPVFNGGGWLKFMKDFQHADGLYYPLHIRNWPPRTHHFLHEYRETLLNHLKDLKSRAFDEGFGSLSSLER